MELKRRREEQHLTQEELSEKSGISVRTIQRIESGQVPKGHTLKALSIALNLPSDKLTPTQTEEVIKINHVKLINLASLPLVFLPLASIALPLLLMIGLKQINTLTKQLLSLQILWTILAAVIFMLSAFLKKAMDLSNQFTLWVMVVLILTNITIVLFNTFSLDRNQTLCVRLNFSML